MLFTYPITATADNWLSNCIVDIVRVAAAAILAGDEPLEWGKAIPAEHLATLKPLRGLKDRYIELCRELKKVDGQIKEKFIEVLESQIAIPDAYAGVTDCLKIQELPEELSDATVSLFRFSFEKLTDIGSPGKQLSLRDEHYRIIYESLPSHCCPFCGIDHFDHPHPDIPRHSLDHYLAITLYPFAGANLRNLLPMCGRCNSSFKSTADVLRTLDGNRRRCTDPHAGPIAAISLSNSLPFAGKSGQLPEWKIDFVPNEVEFETWDDVFKIRLRYRESILNADFKNWLAEFAGWVSHGNVSVDTEANAASALARYAASCDDRGIVDHSFLKGPAFRMLSEQCVNGPSSARVFGLVQDTCSFLA